jgi:predicted ester cyclase
MSIDDNKALVRRCVDEIFIAGRVEAIDELVAPDFVSHTWGFADDGREKLRAATERVHATLTDVEFTIDELVAEGDLVVARVTSSATPTGDFMGVRASGKRYTIGEMHLFRIRDGRVVEHWHQHDALGLMRQLGALPG